MPQGPHRLSLPQDHWRKLSTRGCDMCFSPRGTWDQAVGAFKRLMKAISAQP